MAIRYAEHSSQEVVVQALRSTMSPLQVAAADGGVIDIAAARTFSSGVLARLPERSTGEPPLAVPFGTQHVRGWNANAPGNIEDFETAIAVVTALVCQALCSSERLPSAAACKVLKLQRNRADRTCNPAARLQVADFLEAPTLPWAARAYRVGLAPECSAAARAAATALLATTTGHIRSMMADVQLAMDGSTPLYVGLRAPPHLHAAAVGARLQTSAAWGTRMQLIEWPCDVGARSSRRDFGLDPTAIASTGSSDSRAAAGLGLRATATHEGRCRGIDALTASEAIAAMRALQGAPGCALLYLDAKHGGLDICKQDGASVAQTGGDDDADESSVESVDDERDVSTHQGTSSTTQRGVCDVSMAGSTAPADSDTDSSGGGSGGESSAEDAAAALTDPSAYGLASDAAALAHGELATISLADSCQALVSATAAALAGALAAESAPLQLQSLVVANQPLSKAEAAALAAALRMQTDLRRLSLLGCCTAPAAAQALLDAAAQLPRLAALVLKAPPYNFRWDSAAVLLQLVRFTGLTSLQLHDERLVSVPTGTISSALLALTALQNLDLQESALYESVARSRALLAALGKMPCLDSLACDAEVFCLGAITGDLWAAIAAGATLTRLVLCEQVLLQAAAAGVRCLSRLTALQHLVLTGDEAPGNMGPPSARALASALAAMPRLTHLDIGTHGACAACARALAPAIAQLGGLRELSLSQTFSWADADQIEVPKAFARRASRMAALCVLILEYAHYRLSEGGVRALARWLGRLPRVEVLSLCGCRHTAASAATLCRALAVQASVTCLDLSDQDWFERYSEVSPNPSSRRAQLAELGEALRGLSQLQALSLSDNGLDAEGMRAMGRASGGLGKLRHLDVSGNRLGAAGLRAVGVFVASMRLLECLDVSDQEIRRLAVDDPVRGHKREVVGLRRLRALAEVLCMPDAPEQLRVVARGVRCATATGLDCVRIDVDGRLRWQDA